MMPWPGGGSGWHELGAMTNANLNSWEPCRDMGTCVCACVHVSVRCVGVRSIAFCFAPAACCGFGCGPCYSILALFLSTDVQGHSSETVFPNQSNNKKLKKKQSSPLVISHSIHSCTSRNIFAFWQHCLWVFTDSVAISLFPWTGLLVRFWDAVLVTTMKIMGQCLCVHGPDPLWSGDGRVWRLEEIKGRF